MSLRSSIRGPMNSTRPGSFPEDLESQTEHGLPVVYPPQAVSSDTIVGIVPNAMDIHHSLVRSIQTHLVPSRTMMRIHSLIRGPFRLLTEVSQCWNRPEGSPDIRLGLLAAVTTSSVSPLTLCQRISNQLLLRRRPERL